MRVPPGVIFFDDPCNTAINLILPINAKRGPSRVSNVSGVVACIK
jgi:hypothetical protein